MPKLRIDVFISSTSIDLPEHRRAVSDAILELGLYPIGMERWPLSGENPVKLCEEKVEEAEIYLGIFAFRYGWRPEGYGGKSITEMEYDWAGQVMHEGRPIPRLCFIMEDSYPVAMDHFETDAQEPLNAFKERVKKQEVRFFTTPDDLKAKVLAALAPYSKKEIADAKPYLEWLHQQSNRSALLRVLNRRDLTRDSHEVTIDQVYTQLSIRTKPVPSRWAGGAAAARSAQAGVYSAVEAANMHARLVVLGDPGSGKSTFVNYMALCLTGEAIRRDARDDAPGTRWLKRLEKEGWTHDLKWPILVTLRDLAQESRTARPSATVVYEHLERQLTSWRLESAYPSLCRVIDQGGALLLFDGLDEVPVERREWMRDTILAFVNRLPIENRVIVTCRSLSYTDPEWQLSGFAEGTVQSFSYEQIRSFIGAWYNALRADGLMSDDEANKRSTSLEDGLRQNAHLLPVAENPMLLTVMTVVHDSTGGLPRQSARLYEECVELLMRRWRPENAEWLIQALGVQEHDLYRMLWEIAYEAHAKAPEREGAADIPEPDILVIARKRLKDDTRLADEFLSYVEKTAGLLIGRGHDKAGWRVFTFPHRTFQEYLAGCHIAAGRFARQVKELVREPRWTEVLRLATGQLVFNKYDIATPLDAIDVISPEGFQPATDAEWRRVWLAADMLQIIDPTNAEADEVGKEAFPRVHGLLQILVDEGHLAPIERAAAGRTLSALGDTRPGVGVVPHSQPIPAFDWVEIPDDGEWWFQDTRAEPLPTFYMSRYPVTCAQFEAFEKDPNGAQRAEWYQGLTQDRRHHPIRPPQFAYANHPRENINWFQAMAFCRWLSWRLGGPYGLDDVHDWLVRLPTEAEWEKAARGTDGWLFPYGPEMAPDKGNTSETGLGMTSAVGLFPAGASPYGVLDMSGNVWEWCWTPGGADQRQTVRGGAWNVYDTEALRADFREERAPNGRDNATGFRVCSAFWLGSG